MENIRDLFKRPIDRKIEEVIKVDQADEQTVLQEIQEYVMTDALKNHFYTLYDHIAQYPHDPHEGIGVWVSGFFGSGKSSFIKLIGYTLENKPLGEKRSSDWLIESTRDDRLAQYLKNINSRFPIQAVIFDVSMDRGVRSASERITEIMYKVLLRELGYPEDFDLAELEITLEAENELEKFRQAYEEKYGKNWNKGKKVVANALNEASTLLHELYPERYPSPESYLHAIGEGRADIDPNKLAHRTFELVQRRKKGYGIIYVIDEVGQYVARSTEKMLDLQAVVQALGRESKNRVKAGKARVPAWLIVTSQEKLDEVVDALDSSRIELARLQDRFPITIDLKQSDIQEVTARRVLLKKQDARDLLGKLYDENEGRLKTHCALERTHRQSSFSKEEFIELYPYLPYQIELSIDIVAGLRLKRGGQRHIGGSNRTIIKQAQQMLIHPQIRLADKPLGTLVTLDMIYELLYHGSLLPSETTREVDSIPRHLPGDELALKVAKAIALLEVVKDLPRTVHNIAAVLHPSIEANSLEKEVGAALKRLEKAQFVREMEDGYKLLTVQEKHWDTERQSKSPKERQKKEMLQDFFRSIFSEPSLKTFRYKNLQTFKIGLTLNDQKVEEGNIWIHFRVVDGAEEMGALLNQLLKESREEYHAIFWAFSLNEELHQLFVECFRSRSMIQEYGRIQAQGHISREEMACLEDERLREQRLSQQIKTKLIKALESGKAVFQGVSREGGQFAPRFTEMLKAMLNLWVPDIYPKLEIGARRMTGKEAEQVLTAANLNGLSALFYDGSEGLQLVTKQGDQYLPNMNAPVVQEIFAYLKRENEYGNKVTGKSIENHFSTPPYGWERDLLRLVLAVIFRANQLEVTYQGKKYKSYTEPNARVPFVNQPAFRSATFAPRQSVDLKTLTRAARQYESLTGKEVDVEESAIAAGLQEVAQSNLTVLDRLIPALQQRGLPGVDQLNEFRSQLATVIQGNSEDCVTILANEGNTLKEHHSFLARLNKLLTPDNLTILDHAHSALAQLYPLLQQEGIDGEVQEAAEVLARLFDDISLYECMKDVRRSAETIYRSYSRLYQQKHERRHQLISEAIEKVKGYSGFENLSPGQQEEVVREFEKRICPKLELTWQGNCANCSASLQQLESDSLSVEHLLNRAFQRIAELTGGDDEIITVRIGDYLRREFSSVEEVEEALERLKNEIAKHLLEGRRVFLQ